MADNDNQWATRGGNIISRWDMISVCDEFSQVMAYARRRRSYPLQHFLELLYPPLNLLSFYVISSCASIIMWDGMLKNTFATLKG